jgi:PIN domain nuclease of toxin-antitoxin system
VKRLASTKTRRRTRPTFTSWTRPRFVGWEITIKANKKIFDIDDVPGWWDRRVLPFIDLETVPIREERVRELSRLPGIHKDPFDRMLIAQARTEDMSLVTCDAHIRSYPAVRVVW